MHPKFLLLVFIGFVGIWLMLWDLVDFLTLGLNEGIWNWAILQAGLPSIFVGYIIVCVVSILGIKLFK